MAYPNLLAASAVCVSGQRPDDRQDPDNHETHNPAGQHFSPAIPTSDQTILSGVMPQASEITNAALIGACCHIISMRTT